MTGTTNNGSKTVESLLTMFDDGRLPLPEIQRDFVWTKKSVLLLVDSLFRGHPIGFVLVWRPQRAVPTKAVLGANKNGGQPAVERYGYLLDGQQRLTSLLLLKDQSDGYPLAMNLRPGDEKDRFYWRGRRAPSTPWSIPVAEALRGDFDVAARLKEIREAPDFFAEMESGILDALNALKAIPKHPVGVVEFETDDYRAATDLFVRFNSTGRKLSGADLGMAQLAIGLPDFASSAIRPTAEKWKGMGFTAPFLVQCLLAVHTGRYQMKEPDKIWAAQDGPRLRETWTSTKRAVDKLVAFLTGHVGWKSAREIPSLTALIPLVYLLAHGDKWARQETVVARRWLLLSCLRGYFSKSSQTVLDQTLKALAGEPTPQRLWSFTRRALRKLSGDDFDTGRLSGPAMSLYLSMLRESKARDWGPTLSSLDAAVFGRGTGLQVHHFFPRALLRKHAVAPTKIDTFANYAVISQATNLDAGAYEPATYLDVILGKMGRDANKLRAEFAKQCVPNDQSLWRVARYDEFLKKKARLDGPCSESLLGGMKRTSRPRLFDIRNRRHPVPRQLGPRRRSTSWS